MKKAQQKVHVADGLKAIYGDQSDDLHTVDRGQTPLQRWVKTLLTFSVVACVVVGGAAAVVMRQTWFAPTDPAVTVTAVWTGELTTGQPITLDIRYANPLRRPVANVSLDLNIPPGFQITETFPAPTDAEKYIWHIGSLGRSSDGHIRVTGMVEAAPGAVFPAQVVTTFRPANFNADFSQVTTVQGEVTASVYTLAVEPVTSVFPGESVIYRLAVAAPPEAPAGTVDHPLVLEVQPPLSFRVEKTTPATLSDSTLRLPVVLQNGQGTAEVSGVYTSDATGTQSWSARLVEDRVSGSVPHAQQEWATEVRADGIAVSLVGNGQKVQTDTSRGKSVRLSVRLKNTSSQPIKAETLLLDFQPGSGIPVSWSTAVWDGGTLTRDGIRYTINAELGPGEERIYNPSIPIRTEVRAGDVGSFTVSARLTAGGRTSTTAPFTMRLVDIPPVEIEAVPVAGPSPTVVGQGTTYAVTVTVPKTANDLTDLELTGTLPAGTTFGGITGGTWSPTYNQANRSLQLIAKNKEANEELTVTFTVIAVPGTADIGAELPLWRDLVFRGKDAANSAAFTTSLEALTVEGPVTQ